MSGHRVGLSLALGAVVLAEAIPGPDTVLMVVLVAGAAWLFARYQVRRRKQE